MAILGFKKKKEEKSAKEPVQKAPASSATGSVFENGMASVIVRPWITEKSGVQSQNGIYTFEIVKDANKAMVSKAVRTLYKVNPVKIAIINIPAKRTFVMGKKGTIPGIKKAVVTLKKGEKIDFV